MKEWNHCQFIGHVGTQPKESITRANNMITSFNFAVGQGKGKDTFWLFVKFMGKVDCNKRDKVKIVGRLFCDKWTRDGKENSLWGIFADSIEVVGTSPQQEPEPDEPF